MQLQVGAARQCVPLTAPLGADMFLCSFCLQSDPSSLSSLSWRVPQRPCWGLLSISSPLITSQRPLEFIEIVQLSIILGYLQHVCLFSQPTKPLTHLPPVHPTCRSPSFLLFPRLSFPVFTSFLEFVLLHLPATLSYRQKEQLGLKHWPGNRIPKEPLLFQLTSGSGALQNLSLATCVRSPRVLHKNKKPNVNLEYSSIKQ